MRQIINRQKQEKELVASSDFIKRDVAEKIDTYLEQDIIKVVTGVRRCGKSIFSFMVLQEADFGYINFDEKELTHQAGYEGCHPSSHGLYSYCHCLRDPGLPSSHFQSGTNLILLPLNSSSPSMEDTSILSSSIPFDMKNT